jgi:hypothetical protein
LNNGALASEEAYHGVSSQGSDKHLVPCANVRTQTKKFPPFIESNCVRIIFRFDQELRIASPWIEVKISTAVSVGLRQDQHVCLMYHF